MGCSFNIRQYMDALHHIYMYIVLKPKATVP